MRLICVKFKPAGRDGAHRVIPAIQGKNAGISGCSSQSMLLIKLSSRWVLILCFTAVVAKVFQLNSFSSSHPESIHNWAQKPA